MSTTQYTHFQYYPYCTQKDQMHTILAFLSALWVKLKISLNYPKFAAMGFFSKGLKNKFEIAVVNEPSVFEPLMVYCSCMPQL